MVNEVSKETVEILKNEYVEVLESVTNKVKIERLKAPVGSLLLLKFTVLAPTYYITGAGDNSPKATDSIVFYIDIKNGYPRTKPSVYYEPGKILASVNAFTSGAQCIDQWFYDATHAGRNSTLIGTVRKTLMDIIHIPSVSRYDSMANGSLKDWQMRMTQNGSLPTCHMDTVLKRERDTDNIISKPLPNRRSNVVAHHVTPPALPRRRS